MKKMTNQVYIQTKLELDMGKKFGGDVQKDMNGKL